MVKYLLQNINSSFDDIKLDYTNQGTLTRPLSKCSYVSILRYDLANGALPLMLWDNTINNVLIDGDFKYSFTLTYKGFSSTRYLKYIYLENPTYEFWNKSRLIYTVSHLLIIINDTLKKIVDDLNFLIPLPSLIYPRVIFENNLFSFIVDSSCYDSSLPYPIVIHMNYDLHSIFQSIFCGFEQVYKYYIIFENTPETQYLTSYLKLTQISISVGNFSSIYSIQVTSSMPIESEIISSQNSNSSQSGDNTLQTTFLNYDKGLKNIISTTRYNSISEPFRRTLINGLNLYDIRCQVNIQTNKGTVYHYIVPSLSYSTILLEFL